MGPKLLKGFAASALAGALIASVAATALASGGAHTAGTVALRESATLRVTKSSPLNREAEGHASGTLAGKLNLRVKIENASRLSAAFTGSDGAGTLSGSGFAHYTISGSVIKFMGTVTISRGTGTYAHASGNGIRLEGDMNRSKGTIGLVIAGRVKL